MKNITLRIKDISVLKKITNSIESKQSLSSEQGALLINLFSNVPEVKLLLEEQIPLKQTIQINMLDMGAIEKTLEKWKKLFENIPGYDFAPYCQILTEQTELGHRQKLLLSRGVLMVAIFGPSITYGIVKGEGFEVHLKDNGTASFCIPTLEDAEVFPELYKFNGTWAEAYRLMIETMKKGWPLEEFPKELQRFLPK